MENSPRLYPKENPSPSHSPNSHNSSTNSNGLSPAVATPPATPKPVSRSENNPYPTTFVQADSTTFKQVVQMLTGSSETAKQAADLHQVKNSSIPPIRTSQKKQSFKLYERRNSLKNGLMINPSLHNFANNPGFSPRKPEILSPSILDFPSLVLSPVTPLRDDHHKSSGSSSEEDKAIAEKGFYLHKSPMSTPRGGAEPQLLPLFPVTSPRVSGS
ncbi:hypothetical protein DCAR_0522380 [Daucus carota subsp. sativus]|uniref:VQ domain-containing protein n=1 Tax=Daucus carota subsp. sativus TaxID=79200 RepID=A0A162A6Y7_DAUCS|nr:PREDICTED: VQ motif-containing protein 4 [Daucus carota subsp. sativus]WOH02990.1 hypothetical protein DCAR_0522380 [Daucus carota subsp. sativus]